MSSIFLSIISFLESLASRLLLRYDLGVDSLQDTVLTLICTILRDTNPRFCDLGWMHVLSPKFLDPLAAKRVPVINLHPALPRQYDGIDAIKRAYDDYHRGKLEHDKTGIMIHYVISEVDRGEPIVVREIQCKTPETLEELKTRMHLEENQLIIEGAAMAISNLWKERSKCS
jgi:phosphoribosylglycinamide formyltransferase